MIHRFLLGLLLAAVALLLAAARPAHAATEMVLILDNSGSMIGEWTADGRRMAPADPDRLSVLGTLLLERVKDPGDVLHILNFDKDPQGFRTLAADPAAIRGLSNDAPTYFRGVLGEARRILAASTAERRLLVVLTDGIPSDDDFSEVEAQRLLGLDAPPVPFSILVLGLAVDPRVAEAQDSFLSALRGPDGRYERIGAPTELITRFTTAYAEQLGSRPETGVLAPGGSYTVEVGKYVEQVLVLTASTERAGPYAASLQRDGKDLPLAADDRGDNGCSDRISARGNPRLCKAPFHHYAVWTEPNDPQTPSRWTLSLDSGAKSDVAFGFILRYALRAELLAPPQTARLGEPTPVTARLTWRDQTFDEEAFFSSDGFEAVALLDGAEVPMVRQPDSTFVATTIPAGMGPRPLQVEFRNRWMRLRAETTVLVQGQVELTLAAPTLDFGAWQGSSGAIEQCRTGRIGGQNVARVPLELGLAALPDGARLKAFGAELRPGDWAEMPLGADTVTVCLRSRRCCDAFTGDAVSLTLRGRDPRYHEGAVPVPVRATITAAGFLRCWRWLLLALGVALLVALVLWGILSPRSFVAEARIKVAGDEKKLARAPAVALRDLPGGRRGFYRHATVAFDGSGNPVGPRSNAPLRLRAQAAGEIAVVAAGALQTRNPRTRTWESVGGEGGPVPLRRRIEYRVDSLVFRIE